MKINNLTAPFCYLAQVWVPQVYFELQEAINISTEMTFYI